ncbi:MAG TPA: DUF4383 domain-containing protein [Actinomycetota bacterium]|nr:DUF4383 domain-containing protein [Actinomycetota bacterium]
MSTSASGLNKTPAQLFGLVFGVVYLVVGLVGFAVTGFDNFAGETNEKLIVFALNPLHNIAHIGVGALLLVGSSRHETAKSMNLLVGVVYLLLAILGFAGVLVDEILNVNSADNFLHIGTAALALYFGTVGADAMPGAARTA